MNNFGQNAASNAEYFVKFVKVMGTLSACCQLYTPTNTEEADMKFIDELLHIIE